MICTIESHAAAKAAATDAMARRRRPTATIPRGLVATARPWPEMRAYVGECPCCHSSLIIGRAA